MEQERENRETEQSRQWNRLLWRTACLEHVQNERHCYYRYHHHCYYCERLHTITITMIRKFGKDSLVWSCPRPHIKCWRYAPLAFSRCTLAAPSLSRRTLTTTNSSSITCSRTTTTTAFPVPLFTLATCTSSTMKFSVSLLRDLRLQPLITPPRYRQFHTSSPSMNGGYHIPQVKMAIDWRFPQGRPSLSDPKFRRKVLIFIVVLAAVIGSYIYTAKSQYFAQVYIEDNESARRVDVRHMRRYMDQMLMKMAFINDQFEIMKEVHSKTASSSSSSYATPFEKALRMQIEEATHHLNVASKLMMKLKENPADGPLSLEYEKAYHKALTHKKALEELDLLPFSAAPCVLFELASYFEHPFPIDTSFMNVVLDYFSTNENISDSDRAENIRKLAAASTLALQSENPLSTLFANMDPLEHLYDLQYVSDKHLYKINYWIQKKEERLKGDNDLTIGERRHYETLLYVREMYEIHNRWLESTIEEAKKVNGVSKYVLRTYKDIEPLEDDSILERVYISNPFKNLYSFVA